MSKANQSPSDIENYIHISMFSTWMVMAAIAAVAVGVLAWCAFGTMTDKEYIQGVVFPSDGATGVNIPNGGVVREVFIHKGDKVVRGQSLALISVAGSYSIVSAPYDGVVLSYLPENGEFKAFEDIVDLLSDEYVGNVRTVTAYAGFNSMRFLRPGQTAQVTPTNETRERIGYVRGKVKSVSPYPVSRQEAVLKLQNASLADEIFPESGSAFEVEIELDMDPDNPQEFDWSFSSIEKVDMSVGTFCNIEVVVKSRSLFKYLLENVKEAGNSLRLWAKE